MITVVDLSKARITRGMLARCCLAPWFEDFVKGAFTYLSDLAVLRFNYNPKADG